MQSIIARTISFIQTPQGSLNLPLYYFIGIMMVFVLTYDSFPSQWPLVVVGLLLCTFPVLSSILFEKTAHRWYLAGALSVGGIFIGQAIFILLVPLALFAFFVSMASVVKNYQNELTKVPAILGMFGVAILGGTFYFILESAAVNADNMLDYTILKGSTVPDDLFNISIVNMILDQGYPSTGLNTAPMVYYHYLSHYLLAWMVIITGLPAYEVHHLAIALIFVPLYLFGLVLLLRHCGLKHKNSLNILVLLPFLLFGLYGEPFVHWAVDNTMAVNGFLIYFFFVALLLNRNIWLIGGLLFLLFMSKVSTGAVFTIAYAGVILLDNKTIKQKLFAYIVLLFVFYLGYQFAVYKDAAGRMAIDVFNYYNAWMIRHPGSTVFHYIWHSWGVALCTIAMAGLYGVIHLRNGRFWAFCVSHRNLLLMTFAIYSASFLATILTIDNANHKYFVQLSAWVSVPWLCIICYHLVKGVTVAHKSISILALLSSIGFMIYKGSANVDIYSQFSANRQVAYEKLMQHYNRPGDERNHLEANQAFVPYFTALRYINSHHANERYLVEVPDSESAFWTFTIYVGARHWMPFYIPAFSGKPAYKGYDAASMKNKSVAWYSPGSYGYAYYYDQQDDIDYCTDDSYEGRFIVAKVDDQVTLQRLVCGQTKPEIIKQFTGG